MKLNQHLLGWVEDCGEEGLRVVNSGNTIGPFMQPILRENITFEPTPATREDGACHGVYVQYALDYKSALIIGPPEHYDSLLHDLYISKSGS